MKILLLGAGGREHALAWKIAASPLTTKLWCAPGNAGIAREAECVPIDITDHAAVVAFCRANKVDFVVVGPDNPLVAGIVDDIEAADFGPSARARRRRGSKDRRASPRTCASDTAFRRPPISVLPPPRRPRPMCAPKARRS